MGTRVLRSIHGNPSQRAASMTICAVGGKTTATSALSSSATGAKLLSSRTVKSKALTKRSANPHRRAVFRELNAFICDFPPFCAIVASCWGGLVVTSEPERMGRKTARTCSDRNAFMESDRKKLRKTPGSSLSVIENGSFIVSISPSDSV